MNPPRYRRGSTLAGWALAVGFAILTLLLLEAGWRGSGRVDMAPRLPLSPADPALFTEARYARHASLADRHAAFQDHPMALEHFPAGSLMPPPGHERLD
jgi:hypothetical protein